MASTIIQDKWGAFWRDNGDGTATDLSSDFGTVPRSVIPRPVVIVENGRSTGAGDPLATRIAVFMSQRGEW